MKQKGDKTMEESIDVKLLEALRHAARMHHRPCPPMMGPGVPGPGPGMHIDGQPMHMHGPHGPGMHRLHGGKRFPRERVLMILLAHEEGMHQKELAEEMKIGPSSLSELIDKLESDRYVERNVDPEDRRSTLITLTEKGKARAFEAEDMRRSAAAERFAALTQEEKETLLSLLEKIAV